MPNFLREDHEAIDDGPVTISGASAVEIRAPAAGKQVFIVSVIVDVITAGSAGATLTIRTKTGSTKIIKTEISTTGPNTYFYSERGKRLANGQGIEAILSGAGPSVEVSICGYRKKP